jgi:hypothetical protein
MFYLFVAMIVITAQAFGFPFIEPITAKLTGRGSGYELGANFAFGGATAATNLLASPFSLPLEVLQSFTFRSASTIPSKLIARDSHIPAPSSATDRTHVQLEFCRFSLFSSADVDPSYFERALYVISEIGANDFVNAYSKGLTPSRAIKHTVPRAIKAVRNALEVSKNIATDLGMKLMLLLKEVATVGTSVQLEFSQIRKLFSYRLFWSEVCHKLSMYMNFYSSACTQTLYASGSRSFLVFNAPPAGCTPYILTLYGGNDIPFDRFGCLSEYNEVMKVYNAQLKASVNEYRTRWSDASILFFDSYSATEAILSDLDAYGESQIIQKFLCLQVATQCLAFTTCLAPLGI